MTSYLNKPIDVGEVEQYCRALIESETNIFCAVHERHTDLFVGTCKIGGINDFSGIADIGIMIGEKRFWGKGIGSETVSLLSNYAFNELNLRKLTGGAMSSNKPMLNIFDRLGFIRFGSRVDIIVPSNNFNLSIKKGDKVKSKVSVIGNFIND